MFSSDCVLLRGDAFLEKRRASKTTEASAVTSRNLAIEVSLRCPENPLLPAVLFVTVPGVEFTDDDPPRIVRAVEDLILIRVPIPGGPFPSDEEYDDFIYRIGRDKGTSQLKLLPHTTFLNEEDVGLLRRGEEHYTVAALLAGNKNGVYDLHRFDSETGKWSLDEVPLVEPQVSFPYKGDKRSTPVSSGRLLYHITATVIPIQGGTMGWVDLWRGILLCDVLSTEPKLRGVPLPLPLDHMSCNHGLGVQLGCPKSLRGIAFIDGMEPCLKFVDLGVTAVPIFAQDFCDDEWEMHDWMITTWSNKKMTTSWEDWHMDSQVKASDTTISSELNSKMLKSGLLSSPGGVESERAFQNLLVTFPALGIDDGVVYLQANVRFWDAKVYVLALDTRVNKLLGAVEFGTERAPRTGIMYFPSSIGKHINPNYRMVIPEGDFDESEHCIQSVRLHRLHAKIMRRICPRLSGKVSLDDDTIIAT